jgi:hypothetical protein
VAARRIEEAERFGAVDGDGNEYEVVCYQTFTSFATVATGDVSWLKGAKDYQLADGTDLSANSDGTFSEVGSVKKLRRM